MPSEKHTVMSYYYSVHTICNHIFIATKNANVILYLRGKVTVHIVIITSTMNYLHEPLKPVQVLEAM